MSGKGIALSKLTPAQIALIERLLNANADVAFSDMSYQEIIALDELRGLGLIDLKVADRKRLHVILTADGRMVRATGYNLGRPVLRVTGPQQRLLRFLDDAPEEDSVGRTMSELPGMMLDVCRRMTLRGWAEWHDGWNGMRWARLTPAGRDVLAIIDAAAAEDDAAATDGGGAG